MDAAGVSPRTRHTLDRAQNARPTSVHTHHRRSLTAAPNIEGRASTKTTKHPTGLARSPDQSPYISTRMMSERVMMKVFSVLKSRTSSAGFSRRDHRRQQFDRRRDVDEGKRRLHDRLDRLRLEVGVAR